MEYQKVTKENYNTKKKFFPLSFKVLHTLQENSSEFFFTVYIKLVIGLQR
jgi:hypothetical protein